MKKQLGRSGINVSVMGLGCWAIGGNFLLDGKVDGYGDVNDSESIAALKTGFEMGITFFDTSDAYGTGHSEKIIGKAFKENRDQVVIATKFGYTYDEAKRELIGEDYSPAYIRRACEASLKRLGTEYIDLYQLHLWSIPNEQIAHVTETLEDLKSEGKIRAYGWSTGDVEGARIFAENSNCTAIQHKVNVFDYSKKMLSLCEDHNLASINNMPLAMGLLSGKYTGISKALSNDVRNSGHAWVNYFKDGQPVPEFLTRLESIKEILRCKGRSLVQGALGWLWGKSAQNIPIPGFKSAAQVKENAGALEFGPLSPAQIEEIDRLLDRELS